MLHAIFVKKILQVLGIFSELKSKASFCFKEHGLDLLFLPKLTIKQIASHVFDRSVLQFSNKS